MIMARLLTPADFGIVAMAGIVIALLETFSRLGIGALVIREKDSSRDFYDTAWTAQLLQGTAIGLLLVAAAPLAAVYFAEPKVVPVLRVFAAVSVMAGAVNIGMVLVRKELDFERDFRFQIYMRLVTFVVTIGLAVGLRSYWAVVIGRLVAQVVGVGLSFAMHPYRPRPCLKRIRSFASFAKSLVPYNVARFLNGKFDVLAVGRIAGTASLGLYNVSAELSSTFTREVVGTIGRGLLPNYAKLSATRDRLVEAYLTVLAATTTLAIALGIGLAAVAPEFVAVLLGDQWSAAAPVLGWLSVYGTIVCILEAMSSHILLSVGKEKLSASLEWFRLVLLVPLVTWTARTDSAENVAIAAAAASALTLPVVAHYLTRTLDLTIGQLLLAVWRPAVAAVSLFYVTTAVPPWFDSQVLLLGIKVAVGAVTYIGSLLVLWMLSGRPEGPERLVWNHLWTKKGSSVKLEDEPPL